MSKGNYFTGGYSIVELMVTALVFSILTVVVGTLFVKLLNIQEREREDAYIREKLVEICGIYADYLSLGSAFSTNSTGLTVTYRQETGGVSFETGGSIWGATNRIAHIAKFISSNLCPTNRAGQLTGETCLDFKYGNPEVSEDTPGWLDLNAPKDLSQLHGDDVPLIPLSQLIRNQNPQKVLVRDSNAIRVTLSSNLRHLKFGGEECPALGNLTVTARYDYDIWRAGAWVHTNTTASAERIVRLWNRE